MHYGLLRDGEHRAPGKMPLDRALRHFSPNVGWKPIRRAIESGKVRVDDRVVTDPRSVVEAGAKIRVQLSAPRPRAQSPLSKSAWVHLDRHVIVIDKPPNVSSVPYDETERGALSDLVRAELARRQGGGIPPLGIVHRLDKETSGLILFCRNVNAKRQLKQAFRFHTIERRYVALCHGAIRSQTIRSRLIEDRGDGRRGSTKNPKLGQAAVTRVRVLESFPGATLVECQLETGRTHQIRIHLSEAGHPVVGERVYVHEAWPKLGATRLMLHAKELGFEHPVSGEKLHFQSEPPPDMQRVIDELRSARGR
jgi:23S rRNA pseudouridine1911/1915/1917 synthase